jgi:hypothetical protein
VPRAAATPLRGPLAAARRAATVLATMCLAMSTSSPLARAQTQSGSAPAPPADGSLAEGPATTTPPPLDVPYLQYGVAITTELVTDAGKLCPGAPAVPCIFGSGGGVVARLGRRSAGPWYFGGAYELSKQDPSSLYRFATLQQLRAEGRYYFNTGLDTYPYVVATSGVMTYGDEWGIDTYGPIESLGLGVECQITRRTVVGLAFSYRVLFTRGFRDSSGVDRDESLVQLAGFDLFVEERAPTVSATSH